MATTAIRKKNFDKTIILKVWHTPPLNRSPDESTRCCGAVPIELGHNNSKRLSRRRFWIKCPSCGKEGWEADEGYMSPFVSVKHSWMKD